MGVVAGFETDAPFEGSGAVAIEAAGFEDRTDLPVEIDGSGA
jgi:hypothetical protein